MYKHGASLSLSHLAIWLDRANTRHAWNKKTRPPRKESCVSRWQWRWWWVDSTAARRCYCCGSKLCFIMFGGHSFCLANAASDNQRYSQSSNCERNLDGRERQSWTCSLESTSSTRNGTTVQHFIQYTFKKGALALYSVVFCSSSLGRAPDVWNSQSVHSAIISNNNVRSSRDLHEQLARSFPWLMTVKAVYI